VCAWLKAFSKLECKPLVCFGYRVSNSAFFGGVASLERRTLKTQQKSPKLKNNNNNISGRWQSGDMWMLDGRVVSVVVSKRAAGSKIARPSKASTA
jgi:hypothetical protein